MNYMNEQHFESIANVDAAQLLMKEMNANWELAVEEGGKCKEQEITVTVDCFLLRFISV